MTTYTLEGNRVRVQRPNGTTYALTGYQLDYCIDQAARLMNQCPNQALNATLAEMRGALDVLNAEYASEANTEWAKIGAKGGEL
jgi:hypothetical protein